MVIYFPPFIPLYCNVNRFAFENGFSGQVLYEIYIFQFYNILFATLPIILYALIDKEYPGMFLEANPSKYTPGLKDSYFNPKIFWTNVASAIAQALVLPLVSFYTLQPTFVNTNGNMLGFWNSGMMCFGAVVIMANLKILLFSYTVNIFTLLGIFTSITVFILSFFVFNLNRLDTIYEEFLK